jgi:hypothetical protein
MEKTIQLGRSIARELKPGSTKSYSKSTVRCTRSGLPKPILCRADNLVVSGWSYLLGLSSWMLMPHKGVGTRGCRPLDDGQHRSNRQ